MLAVQMLCSDRTGSEAAILQTYRDWKDEFGLSQLDDTEHSETEKLKEGEEMDTKSTNMTHIVQVRLVFAWHEEQLETLKELNTAK